MENIVIMSGENIELTLPTDGDIDYLLKWINDIDITKYLRFPNMVKFRKDEEEWLENLRKNQEVNRVFIIRNKDNKIPIGTIGIHSIDKYNRHAELGYLLGKENWGKGYMTEAVGLALKYSFHVLNLRKVYAYVKDGNIGSVRVLIKNGFQEVGRLKEHDYVPFEGYKDLLIFEKLNTKESNK